MKEETKMKWPFKHLKQDSSWPLQNVACALSAVVIQAPPELRKEAMAKTIERAFRLAARVCRELEIHPARALEIAEEQLCREIPGAKAAILAVRGEKAADTEDQAQDLLKTMLGGPETGEA
jgi:hypothetical protein